MVENYRPQITVDPKWPLVKLGDLTKPQYGYTASAEDDGDARFVRITDIGDDGMLRSDDRKYISLDDKARKLLLEKGDILVSRTGSYGKTMMFNEDYPAVFASYLIRLRFDTEKVDPRYYWAFAQTSDYCDASTQPSKRRRATTVQWERPQTRRAAAATAGKPAGNRRRNRQRASRH